MRQQHAMAAAAVAVAAHHWDHPLSLSIVVVNVNVVLVLVAPKAEKVGWVPLLCGGVVIAFKSDDKCDNNDDNDNDNDGNVSIVGAMRLELDTMLALQNESFVLVCTLFLGGIGF
jgi:hypothetical protein